MAEPYLNYLKNKGRFIVWIATFLALLVLVAVLTKTGFRGTAKTVGIIVLVTIVVALWVWRIQTKSKAERTARIKMNVNDKHWLKEHIGFYADLNKKDKKVFQDRIGIFLSDIRITEVDKEVAEKETCYYVASAAIIAFWGLPYWNYGDLTEVLVYPSNFDMNNELNKRGLVSGKVHHGGLLDSTMILSLPALKRGFSNQTDKKNVGVHEFAHLIDKEDGSIDGVPFMVPANERLHWVELVKKEMKAIQSKHSDINKYAATNPQEFFAVVTEYYKERPELMEKKHPELFQMMEEMFSIDPITN